MFITRRIKTSFGKIEAAPFSDVEKMQINFANPCLELNFEINFKTLSSQKQRSIYKLVIDLLSLSNKQSNVKFYLGQLLCEFESLKDKRFDKDDRINKVNSYARLLSQQIYAYIACCTDKLNGDLSGQNSDNIYSAIRGMLRSRNSHKDNPYIEYICDYFSVDKSVLLYGHGHHYHLNEQVYEYFKNNVEKVTGLPHDDFILKYAGNFIKGLEEVNPELNKEVKKENIEYNNLSATKTVPYYILYSDKVRADIVSKILKENFNDFYKDIKNRGGLLISEDIEFEFTYEQFMDDFNALKSREREMILKLVLNLTAPPTNEISEPVNILFDFGGFSD